MAISTNGVMLTRLTGALYNQQLGAATYAEVLAGNSTAAALNTWANAAVAADFGSKTDLQVATTLITNVGLSSVAGLANWVAGQLTAGGVAKRGETIISLLNNYSNMDTTEAIYGASVATFNTKVDASQALSQTTGNTGGTYAAISTANTALTLTSAVQTSTGTAGDDTFTAAAGAWGTGDIVNGGAGTDTLNATVTGTAPTQSATSLVSIETLNLTASPNPSTLDLTGVTGLTSVNNVSSANGASLAVAGLGNVVNTTITGGNTATSIAYTTAATVGLTDAATLSLKGTAAGSTFTTSGVETLTINSGTSANTLTTLSAAGMTKLVITGDQALTIIGTVGNSGTTTPTTAYDASAATGAVTLTQTGSGLGTLAAGVTVTGPTAATAGAFTVTTGGNNDTVTLGANANTVLTGAGNDTITSGGGANTITPGLGNDAINAGAGVDTIRFAEVGAANADTVNTFGATDVIAINIGAAAVTGTNAAAATATAAFGVVPTGATSPVLQNVAGTATANAVVFQTAAPATATANTIAQASNVVSLNGVYTDGTPAGVIIALGATGVAGVTTTATGRFLLGTYSVGNIAQIWSYGGDGSGTGTLDTNIEALELSLVATLNGVALNGLTAANFATYLTPATTSTTVSSAGQTIGLTGTLNLVQSSANTAGQFLTAANDIVNVQVGALPVGAASTSSGMTIIDPSLTDADVLNATVLGDWAAGSLVSGIETINLNMLVAGTTFSAAAKTPGTTQFGLTGTGDFVVTAMPNAGGVTLNSGYTGQASVGVISAGGASDSMVVNLAGSTATTATAGASVVYTTGATMELATVNVSAASSIRSAATGLFSAVAEVTEIKLAGSGSLNVFATPSIFGTMSLNGSDVGYTGTLTLTPSGTTGAMDLVGSGAVSGVKAINLSAMTSASALVVANTITLPAVVGGASLTITNAPTTANLNVTGLGVQQTGSSLNDSLTVAIGANGTGSFATGGIVAVGTEALTITNAGTSATTTTLALITLDDAVGNQTVTISGAGNYVLNTVIADSLTTTGVTGTVSATLGNTSAGAVFIGGPGATTIVGTVLADNITTGNATNSITGGKGADIMTGGVGIDTFIFNGAAAAASSGGANGAAIADIITNFTRGTDKLQFTNVVDVGTDQDAVQAAVTALAANSTDAQIATAMAAANLTNLGLTFAVFNGSTYVYYETTGGTSTHVLADNVFIKLTGVTTLPTIAADVTA